MGLWNKIGGIAGGVGGFVVGGPAGAVAGYGVGSAAGGVVDDALHSGDGAPQGQAQAPEVVDQQPYVTPNSGTMFTTGSIDAYNQAQAAQAKVLQDRNAYLAAHPEVGKGGFWSTVGGDEGNLNSSHNLRDAGLAANAAKQTMLNSGAQAERANVWQQAHTNQFAAPTVRPAPLANTTMGTTNFGTTALHTLNDRQSRGYQVDALGNLRSAANGQAPSAAAMQMAAGEQANQRQALSLAAGARGGAGNQAQALSQAINANAAGNQGLIQQTGALRAQEMAQARGQYSGASDQLRGADTTQMINMGAFGLNQNTARARFGLDQSKTMAGIQQADAFKRADISQGTSMANAQFAQQNNALNSQNRLGLLGQYNSMTNNAAANQIAGSAAQTNANVSIKGINAGVGNVNTQVAGQRSMADLANATATQNAAIGAGSAYMAAQASRPQTQPYGSGASTMGAGSFDSGAYDPSIGV